MSPVRFTVHLLALAAAGLALGSAVCAASPEPAPSYAHVGATPPPHGYPVITQLSISTTDVHAGGDVTGTVETSANVTYVEARIQYRNVALHHDAPGKFSLAYHIPWYLPPWLRHGYTLEIVARTVDGVEEWRGIPIHVH